MRASYPIFNNPHPPHEVLNFLEDLPHFHNQSINHS